MCKSNKLTSPFVKCSNSGFVGGFDTTFAHAKQGFDPLAPLLVVKSSKEKKLSPTPSTSQKKPEDKTFSAGYSSNKTGQNKAYDLCAFPRSQLSFNARSSAMYMVNCALRSHVSLL